MSRLICLFCRLFGRSIEIAAYVWVYDNFCVYTLPWNSPWTWVLTMLGVDLGYYWVHRFAHGLFSQNQFSCGLKVLRFYLCKNQWYSAEMFCSVASLRAAVVNDRSEVLPLWFCECTNRKFSDVLNEVLLDSVVESLPLHWMAFLSIMLALFLE